ncbi:type IV fimbrial biogenesis protein FimT [Alkalispirillum mobile]|uniref:Type II secretion system protein H n=1 Tax=Alkalispirillum mobile TaxID=85925 RepID=A0A498BXU7_9GAMM|nr:GspH/FimT family pseudopilin [Alkalispirillum mobile]RLK48634.1 type IV fimbrial biogenesis protein FimT [Alkalispirillum mobile]
MQTQRGFTLVELMITVIVLAVVAGIAYPSLQWTIARSTTSSDVNRLISDLAFARSEAVQRGLTVTLTPEQGNWSSGWQITDENAELLRETSALGGQAVTSGAGGQGSGPDSITFTSMGRVDSGSQIIRYQHREENPLIDAREIRVSRMGQASVCTTDNSGSCWD